MSNREKLFNKIYMMCGETLLNGGGSQLSLFTCIAYLATQLAECADECIIEQGELDKVYGLALSILEKD